MESSPRRTTGFHLRFNSDISVLETICQGPRSSLRTCRIRHRHTGGRLDPGFQHSDHIRRSRCCQVLWDDDLLLYLCKGVASRIACGRGSGFSWVTRQASFALHRSWEDATRRPKERDESALAAKFHLCLAYITSYGSTKYLSSRPSSLRSCSKRKQIALSAPSISPHIPLAKMMAPTEIALLQRAGRGMVVNISYIVESATFFGIFLALALTSIFTDRKSVV